MIIAQWVRLSFGGTTDVFIVEIMAWYWHNRHFHFDKNNTKQKAIHGNTILNLLLVAIKYVNLSTIEGAHATFTMSTRNYRCN